MLDDDDDLARQAKILEMQLAALLIGNTALRDEIARLEADLSRKKHAKNRNDSSGKLSKLVMCVLAIGTNAADLAPMLCEPCNVLL